MKKFFKLSILSAAIMLGVATLSPTNSSATMKDHADPKPVMQVVTGLKAHADTIGNGKPKMGDGTKIQLYCHYKIFGKHFVKAVNNQQEIANCNSASGSVDSNPSNY